MASTVQTKLKNILIKDWSLLNLNNYPFVISFEDYLIAQINNIDENKLLQNIKMKKPTKKPKPKY